MKNSINYLPQNKQDELKKIVTIICGNCDDVEKIILFGSYARGDYKESKDLKPDRKSGHVSDYDLLVVTAKKQTAIDTSLWHKISNLCNKGKKLMPFRIIRHDIEELNIKLAKGQYFYTDIKKEGIVLYDTATFKLARKRKLTNKERQRIAQDYFDYWFSRARMFFEDFNSNLEKSQQDQGYLGKAAFELHQASESCYKTILLVFSNYLPNDHYLSSLGASATRKNPALKNIFPKKTKQQRNRFELLESSYIGGRYDPEFYISKEDLEILAISGKKLLEITEKICKDKISNLLANS
jgi:predicted nucleotidyltransferase/HEPN domain-containing protein